MVESFEDTGYRELLDKCIDQGTTATVIMLDATGENLRIASTIESKDVLRGFLSCALATMRGENPNQPQQEETENA